MIKPIHAAYAITALLIITVIAYCFLPDSKFSSEEYQELRHGLYEMNQRLPEITSLGSLEKIELKEDTLIWDILNHTTGRDIEDFFINYQQSIRANFENLFLILYHGNKTARFYHWMIDEKGMNFKFQISFNDGFKIEEKFTNTELKRFFESCDLTKQRALAENINRYVHLYNGEGVITPFIEAIFSFISASEATPFGAWLYEDSNTIYIAFHMHDDDLFNWMKRYMDDYNAYEKLEKMVYKIRSNNDYTDFFINTFQIADAKLLFKIYDKSYSSNIDIPIPFTNRGTMIMKEFSEDFNNNFN